MKNTEKNKSLTKKVRKSDTLYKVSLIRITAAVGSQSVIIRSADQCVLFVVRPVPIPIRSEPVHNYDVTSIAVTSNDVILIFIITEWRCDERVGGRGGVTVVLVVVLDTGQEVVGLQQVVWDD